MYCIPGNKKILLDLVILSVLECRTFFFFLRVFCRYYMLKSFEYHCVHECSNWNVFHLDFTMNWVVKEINNNKKACFNP